jgi:hypothetical protein
MILDFGASTCSKRSSEPCVDQNHLRENIEKIAKEQNRLHFDSDANASRPSDA